MPVTCGVAIDVPLSVAVAVSLVLYAEMMLDPGAKMSTMLPKFENDDRASMIVVEPTVIASDTRAGGDRVGHAREDRRADRGVERRGRRSAEAHVRHRGGDVIRRHPVDPRDDA